MRGCGGKSKPWTKHKDGAWVWRNSDGHTLRVVEKNGSWHWKVRLPSGGYDVYSGIQPDRESAQMEAEKALQGLLEEIRKSFDARKIQG